MTSTQRKLGILIALTLSLVVKAELGEIREERRMELDFIEPGRVAYEVRNLTEGQMRDLMERLRKDPSLEPYLNQMFEGSKFKGNFGVKGDNPADLRRWAEATKDERFKDYVDSKLNEIEALRAKDPVTAEQMYITLLARKGRALELGQEKLGEKTSLDKKAKDDLLKAYAECGAPCTTALEAANRLRKDPQINGELAGSISAKIANIAHSAATGSAKERAQAKADLNSLNAALAVVESNAKAICSIIDKPTSVEEAYRSGAATKGSRKDQFSKVNHDTTPGEGREVAVGADKEAHDQAKSGREGIAEIEDELIGKAMKGDAKAKAALANLTAQITGKAKGDAEVDPLTYIRAVGALNDDLRAAQREAKGDPRETRRIFAEKIRARMGDEAFKAACEGLFKGGDIDPNCPALKKLALACGVA